MADSRPHPRLLLLFFLLVFTPLGDSLAASGRQALLRSTGNSRQRLKLAAMVESGVHRTEIEACAPELVDSIPCDDPKRNIRLSREMNFYRERHCPFPAEMPLCLIPPPQGYKISIPWPDSLSKI
ncbi:hypothetical protein V2J09_005528 [Rumex salicifolius]